MKEINQQLGNKIQQVIKKGGVIAYPTESVYGLGCDPFSEQAVNKIATLKGRTLDKGFILIASQWEQITHFIATIDPKLLEVVKASWPGPVTWVFPCSDKVPRWIRGDHNSIALRITAHPIAREICELLGMAIVSTSANYAAQEPARFAQAVREIFENKIDLIIEGKVGELGQPTAIRDVLTGDYLRQN